MAEVGFDHLVAEFERAMIRECVCAGLDKARANAKRLGRPQVAVAVAHAICAARAAGESQLPIVDDFGVRTMRRALSVGA
jgi:DNA invertase Pin-like site-specific DNA recombinase